MNIKAVVLSFLLMAAVFGVMIGGMFVKVWDIPVSLLALIVLAVAAGVFGIWGIFYDAVKDWMELH